MSYQVTKEVSNGASGVRHNYERNTSEFTQFPGSLWLARPLGETISTGHDTDFKDVDMLVQTRFDGGTNLALVHAALRGARIVPTPRLICDYARNDHMTYEEARTLITTINAHRSWENSPYVAQLLALLE